MCALVMVSLFIQTVERRRAYTNSKAISEITKAQSNCSPTRNIRSQTSSFQFRDHCLLCGQPAKYSGNKRGNAVFPVRTSDFQATFMQVCTERNDTLAHTIRGRIEFAQDLHAADAIYHQVCSIHFRTGKQVPSTFQATPGEKKRRIGRLIDTAKEYMHSSKLLNT